MRVKKSLILLSLLLAASSMYGSLAVVTLTSFNQGQWQLGYPYKATINFIPNISVMCNDWNHGGLPGDTWIARTTNLGSGDTSNLRFNQSAAALVRYKEAGYILLSTPLVPSNQYTGMNQAVWHILTPSAPMTDPFATIWYTRAQQAALLGFPGVPFDLVTILTPLNQHDPDPHSPQEMMTLFPVPFGSPTGGPATPEPSTLVLLATGLSGLSVARWRRR